MKDVATVRPSLPSLVSSRICHDLVNPLGALGNGLELIQLRGQGDSPEMQLMSDSIDNAASRLNFFRIAFGLAGSDHELTAAAVREVLRGYFGRGRLRVAWHPEGTQARDEVRLALLSILCAESALPLGGRLEVRNGGVRWILSATGPRIAVEPELWAVLSGECVDAAGSLTAGQVHFALAADAARAMGRPIVHDAGAEDLELSF